MLVLLLVLFSACDIEAAPGSPSSEPEKTQKQDECDQLCNVVCSRLGDCGRGFDFAEDCESGCYGWRDVGVDERIADAGLDGDAAIPPVSDESCADRAHELVFRECGYIEEHVDAGCKATTECAPGLRCIDNACTPFDVIELRGDDHNRALGIIGQAL